MLYDVIDIITYYVISYAGSAAVLGCGRLPPLRGARVRDARRQLWRVGHALRLRRTTSAAAAAATTTTTTTITITITITITMEAWVCPRPRRSSGSERGRACSILIACLFSFVCL